MTPHLHYNRWSEAEKKIFHPIAEVFNAALLSKMETAKLLCMHVTSLNKLILEDKAPPYITINIEEHIHYYFPVTTLLSWLISNGYTDTTYLFKYKSST